MVSEGRNAAIVREYIEAIETFDLQAVGRLLHPEVVQIERPNKLYANGQSRGYDKMMADLPRGAKVLRKQSYPITAMHEAGDTVVVETRWEGISTCRWVRCSRAMQWLPISAWSSRFATDGSSGR